MTACLMLVDATMTCAMRGEVGMAIATGEEAFTVARNLSSTAQLTALVAYAHSLMLDAQASRVTDLLSEAMQTIMAYGAAPRDPWIPPHATVVLAWLERYDDALKVSQVVLDTARRRSAIGLLPLALIVRAGIEIDVGEWSAAYAHALEAVDLARVTGQENTLSYCLATMAGLEASTGLSKECREDAHESLKIVDSLGDDAVRTHAGAALGALELGLGRYSQAVSELRMVSDLVDGFGMSHPGVVRWAPDLIEALAHVGNNDEAWHALDTFQVNAERVGTPWAKSAVSRCRGILADDDFESHFETALRTHQQDVLPFERARTELAYGERLRRSRRRADSRTHLRKAHEMFERLGASPWADRASAELRATGERARRRDPTTALDLTPQEHIVAEAVAQGATNKEVAATLFLSPKTIESHLSRIYTKLGVRSRGQLIHRWKMSSK